MTTEEPIKDNIVSTENNDQSFKAPLLINKTNNEPKDTVDSNKAPGQFKGTAPPPADYKAPKVAHVLTTADVPLKYQIPEWACEPPETDKYSLQVLKDGKLLNEINLSDRNNQTYFVVGRLEGVDMKLDHPSVSRYHAILQYGADTMQRTTARKQGWHLYDLDSTHGTVRNKQKLPGRQYVRLHVGHVIKFGGSSRLFIVQGPSEDEEPESKLSVTEIKERAQRRKMIAQGIIDPDPQKDAELIAERKKAAEKDGSDGEEEIETDRGASWGMSENYGIQSQLDEEEDKGEGIDFELLAEKDAYYRDDPKKALKHFFDREGLEMTFEYNEKGASGIKHQWNCRIELPLGNGRSVFAEASVSGHKRDAQVQCALEACRILDANGILRKSGSSAVDQAQIKLKNLQENDYYSSDEDTFYDRTGQLEEKRSKRKRRIEEIAASGSKASNKAMTYKSLCAQMEQLSNEMKEAQTELDKISHTQQGSSGKGASTDSLDEYMSQVKNTTIADTQKVKIQKSQLRLKIVELKHEIERLEKLAKVAKPVDLPSLSSTNAKSSNSSETADSSCTSSEPTKKRAQIWIGSMKGRGPIRKTQVAAPLIEKPVEMETDQSSSQNTPMDQSAPCTSNEEKSIKEDAEQTVPKEQPQKSLAMKEVEKQHEKLKVPPETKEGGGAEISEKSDKPTSSPQETISEKSSNPEIETPSAPQSTKRSRTRNRPQKESKEQKQPKYEEINDPDFAVWMPPDTQSGDGKTSLNDKYGY